MGVGNEAYSHDVENLGEICEMQINYPSRIPQLSRVRKLYTFLVAVLMAAAAMAQVPRGAEKAYERALEAYQAKDLNTSLEELNKAISKYETYADAHFLLAQTQKDLHNIPASIVALERGLDIRESKYPRGWLELAEMLWVEGEYERGVGALARFKDCRLYKRLPDDAQLSGYYHWLKRGLEFSVREMANSSNKQPVELPGFVNSDMPEYYPSLTLDNKVMIFTRRIRGEGVTEQEDFYMSKWSNKTNGWRTADPIPGINTRYNEGAAAISGDGLTIIFTACEGPAVGYGLRDGKGSCDLFESRYNLEKGVWSKGENLETLNSGAWESQPTLSSDGNFMVFARARHIQGMGSDLFASHRKEDGTWAKPYLLPGEVNTGFEEESPFLHSDGQTLYFSSNGHAGFGGLDMFMSKLQEDGSWGAPVNLGYPLNTHNDENSLVVETNGEFALFASDRNKESGDLDMWRVELPKECQSNAVEALFGYVVDDETSDVIDASVVLIDAANGRLVASVTSAPNSGFVLPLPALGTYSFEVEKQGYMFKTQELTIDKISDKTVEVRLRKIMGEESFDLSSIHFESGSAILQDVYQADLVKLVNWMEINPDVKIEVVGHTDNVGTDEDNQILSESRAHTICEFLIANKIEETRLSYSGRGSSEPVQDNSSEIGKKANRRVEILIK